MNYTIQKDRDGRYAIYSGYSTLVRKGGSYSSLQDAQRSLDSYRGQDPRGKQVLYVMGDPSRPIYR